MDGKMISKEDRTSLILLCMAAVMWVAWAGLAGYVWYITKDIFATTQSTEVEE
jgi:hypothetical protein